MNIIDSHIHCSVINVNQPYEKIKPLLDEAGCTNCAMIPAVEDIYDRNNVKFKDGKPWQKTRYKANSYILKLSKTKNIYPIFFVWNDFNIEQFDKGFVCVKWHRHKNEPEYNYNDDKCQEFLNKVYLKKTPILLEEEFKNTLYLINRINKRTNIIIPHLGALNGGFRKLYSEDIWSEKNVFADTALASTQEIEAFLKKYGADKLIFGSDYPFSTPTREVNKIKKLKLDKSNLSKICANNILSLYNRNKF